MTEADETTSAGQQPPGRPSSGQPTSPRPSRLRVAAGSVLTAVAAVVVLLALNVPNQRAQLEVSAFVRLPLEALAYLAVVLALPRRLGWLQAVLALSAGLVLALAAVSRVLDMGFLEAFDRPFDPVIDWVYAASFAELVRDSLGTGLGTLVLGLAALAGLAILMLTPLAVLRLTRVAARRRAAAVRAVAALLSLWMTLALLDVRGDAGQLATRVTADYVYDHVTRIPDTLRDQREFARAAEEDPFRGAPARELLTGLRGKDVLFVFVESFGRVAVEDPAISSGVTTALDSGTRQLLDAGFASRSAFLTSPTFGGLSWLAHSTLQSGLWVDNQQRYDVLLASPRLTLSRLFKRAGWRAVAAVPANTRDWPQGAFYGFDEIYDSRNLGYRGPRFGYPTMPDQFTLEALHRLELAQRSRRPVMAEVDLVTSHVPWAPVPPLLDPSAVGDGSVYQGMPERLPSEREVWTSPERVRAAYADSIEYSLDALVSFVTTHGDDDLVVVLLGDHQPATIVSGEDAGHDVPIAIVSGDPAVLGRLTGWDWSEGLRPEPEAPVWRMDEFRDRFLAAFGPSDDGGAPQPVGQG